jgi:hypothetical protein
MADVDMPDAPTPAPASTAVTKKKSGVDGEGKEGKKRFEVKKVYGTLIRTAWSRADGALVECGGPLGVGYCCRQLRYLQEPHHGSL